MTAKAAAQLEARVEALEQFQHELISTLAAYLQNHSQTDLQPLKPLIDKAAAQLTDSAA